MRDDNSCYRISVDSNLIEDAKASPSCSKKSKGVLAKTDVISHLKEGTKFTLSFFE